MIKSKKELQQRREELPQKREEEEKKGKSAFKTVVLNNIVVKPLKNVIKEDTRPILGYDMIPKLYCNIGILSKKFSGKTTVIQNIVKSCSSKKTQIYYFSATVNLDGSVLALKDWCKRNGRTFTGFSSLNDGKLNILTSFKSRIDECRRVEAEELTAEDEHDQIQEELKTLRKEGCKRAQRLNLFKDPEEDLANDSQEEEEYEDEEDLSRNPLFAQEETLRRKLFKPVITDEKEVFQSPDYILIFDDLSGEIRNPSLVELMKNQRHYRTKVISSSQYIKDLLPSQIQQLDFLLLFGGITVSHLEKVHKDVCLNIDFDKFHELYKDATSEKYNFLYIDIRSEQYRKNFNKLYVVSK